MCKAEEKQKSVLRTRIKAVSIATAEEKLTPAARTIGCEQVSLIQALWLRSLLKSYLSSFLLYFSCPLPSLSLFS